MSEARGFALITGASGGIGAEFARIFAREGWNIVLVARDPEKLERLSYECGLRHGIQSHTLARDLSLPGAAQELFDSLAADKIAVEALVNNAGFATYGLFKDIPLDVESQEIALNVVTLTELTKLFLKPMLSNGRGRILNVASTAAFFSGPLMAVYYATKGYVLSFSEALSNELAGTGVTLTCLCPGATETGFEARGGLQESRLFKGRKLATAASVAEAGYEAMLAGRRLEIPGAGNKLGAFVPRILPRGLLLHMVRRIQSRV
ncbi:MAG: SDR family NAD(P)-dependent oxidoreductase [Vulcanimicrobiaceae bacterium]